MALQKRLYVPCFDGVTKGRWYRIVRLAAWEGPLRDADGVHCVILADESRPRTIWVDSLATDDLASRAVLNVAGGMALETVPVETACQ